jgi:Tol biopolymer transport system component
MSKRLLYLGISSILAGCLLLIGVISCNSSSSNNLSVFSQPLDNYEGHTWSPDGHWLVSESTDRSKLSLFRANGQLVSELRLGCYLGGGEQDFSWLADGRLSCFVGNGPPSLVVFTLTAGGNVSKKDSILVSQPSNRVMYAMQWNPHHFWLATITNRTQGGISPTLYITDLQGHNLISPMDLTTQDGEALSWSPDGTILAIVDTNGDIQLWKAQQSPTGQLLLTNLRLLKTGTPVYETIAWSPSGHWLVCRHETSQGEDYLFLLATNGSGKQVKLTSSYTDGQLYDPAWSPDGKQLIVSRVSDGALMSLNIAQLLKDKGVKP